MADKVKHWPSWANWYARGGSGDFAFYKEEPIIAGVISKYWRDDLNRRWLLCSEENDICADLELVEIDPATPWQESKQRRPE